MIDSRKKTQWQAMTTFFCVLYLRINFPPVRWAAESRRASCCASGGACGPGSASPTTSLVTTSSGRQPATRDH